MWNLAPKKESVAFIWNFATKKKKVGFNLYKEYFVKKCPKFAKF
jgi:hypothetical protein